MEEEIFYVGVRDPVGLRKSILHSSKSVIDALKRYEDYRMAKEEKIVRILELKRVFDELIVLNKKVRGKLPRKTIREFPVILTRELEEATRGIPLPVKKARAELKPKEKTKLEQLEAELAKVEQRLSSLE